MKSKKILLIMIVLILPMILSNCGSNNTNETIDVDNKDIDKENAKDNEIVEKTEFSLNNVILLGQSGNKPEDYKLSFLCSDNMDGVKAYGICYSTSDASDVFEYLKGMSKAEIDKLELEHKLYIMKNLDYADGVGNTYNQNQQDVVNGDVMSNPGEYNFYAITIGENGMLGFAQADRTITIPPYAKNLICSRSGYNLDVTFDSYKDDVIDYNLFFISKTNLDDINMKIGMLTKGEVAKLDDDNKAIECENKEKVSLKIDLTKMHDAYGNEFNSEEIYYTFVASVGKNGKILGISKSPSMIFPNTIPEEVKEFKTGEGNGFIFPNGGAATTISLSKDVLGYIKSVLGGRPRVAVFLASSGTENDNYAEFPELQNLFKQVGMDAVYIPLNTDNYKYVADEKYLSGLVKSCHGIYFAGGDQAKISRVTHNDDGTLNEIGKSIIDIVKKGGFAVGTSAGCNIMSNPTYLQGESNYVISMNKTEFISIGSCEDTVPSTETSVATEGIGLAEEMTGMKILMDSHFDARSRLGRMLVAIRDNNIDVGIGCDEGTGISITKGLGTVYGPNAVFIVDARSAEFSSAKDDNFTVKNIKINYLTQGDQYNFATGLVMPRNKHLAEVIESDWSSDDIFNYDGYNTTRAIVTTAFNSAERSEFGILDSETKFVLIKNENTKVYAGEKIINNSKLQNYPKCTIVDMELCIE